MPFDDFKSETNGAYNVFRYQPWVEKNIVHGFIGSSGNFRGEGLASELLRFQETFGQQVILPEQTHSDRVFCLSECAPSMIDADGVYTDREDLDVFLGVRTADCLPVLFVGNGCVGAIHSGWRGLANNIVVKHLKSISQFAPFEIVVGPAATKSGYEVGLDVIEAIGSDAVFLESANGRYLLDQYATLRSRLVSSEVNFTVFDTLEIDTITSQAFHSYRRDRDVRGSNLGFISLSF